MQVIDKSSPVPLYLQIAEWIEDRVSRGEWAVNYKLKSEDELAEELSVSRGTARKAIGELVGKGVLVQIQGRGTFVALRKHSQPLGQRLISFAEAMAEQGLVYRTEVLAKGVAAASEEIAVRLGIAAGSDVFYLKRVRSSADTAIMLLENYVRLDLCPGLENVDFEADTLFSGIEDRCGVRIAWGKRDFEARVANAEHGKRLGVKKGTALLYLEQIVYTGKGTAVETSNVWIRGDQFRLTSIISR